MAETSGFWTTSGTPSGHQVASYTQALASTAMEIVAACSGKEGVAPNYLNELEGSVTGANTAQIDTGGAVVDGKWYKNDAAISVNIPSAVGGGNTRIDRIVLRCTWANFEVEVTRIAGTDAASPSAPAITQTTGTTYDILLYQALVDTSGSVTLTDERTWATRFLQARQGGDPSDWDEPGTTDYTPTDARMQAGCAQWSGANASTGQVAITFPVSFSAPPIVVATALDTGPFVFTLSATASGTTLGWRTYDSGVEYGAVKIAWIAIGPA